MTLDKVYRPKGFLARFIEDDEEREKSEKDGKKKRKLPFRVDPDIWFNRVDGGHLGAKISSRSSRSRVAFAGGGAYNLGLKRWSLNGKATMRWGANNKGFVSLAGFRGTETRYRSRLYSRFKVSLRQIRGLEDYFDYFWREGVRGTAGLSVWPSAQVGCAVEQWGKCRATQVGGEDHGLALAWGYRCATTQSGD